MNTRQKLLTLAGIGLIGLTSLSGCKSESKPTEFESKKKMVYELYNDKIDSAEKEKLFELADGNDRLLTTISLRKDFRDILKLCNKAELMQFASNPNTKNNFSYFYQFKNLDEIFFYLDDKSITHAFTFNRSISKIFNSLNPDQLEEERVKNILSNPSVMYCPDNIRYVHKKNSSL